MFRDLSGFNRYFIVSGEVEVTCNFTGSGSTRSSSFSSEASLNETESKHNASDNRFSTWIADLGEGSIFGECSVLYGELCNANVRAVSFINCLVLSKKDLSVGCRLYPELLSRLEELAVERKQELAEIQDVGPICSGQYVLCFSPSPFACCSTGK